jgi:hypothetical protein
MQYIERTVPIMLAEDKFRNVDRGIKTFLKTQQQDFDPRAKKRSWYDNNNNESTADSSLFTWEDVVDSNCSSSKLRFLKSVAGCCCREAHDCSNTEGMKIYELENYPSGLFFISRALCDNAQILWAQRALEVYSTVEHTNLSNLQKQEMNCNTADDGVTEKKESVEDYTDLWARSIREKDNFAGFKKLRWSCLGYHYGKRKFDLLFTTKIITILF